MSRAHEESATNSSSCMRDTSWRTEQPKNWIRVKMRLSGSSWLQWMSAPRKRRLVMPSTHKTAMGAFVIGGLLLFGLGLFLIGDRRMLFSKSADYYAEFAQVSSLEAGARVRVGGMEAGEGVELRVPQGP